MDKNKVIQAATKFVQKGQFDKAIGEYQKILKEDPKDVRILLKVGELYQKKGDNSLAAKTLLQVAESYSGDGFFLKAVAVYKQVLKLDPVLIDVNIKLAELYQQLGLMSDAMAQFQLVANHHEKGGNAPASLDILKRMVDLDPDNVASRIKLAELYARDGRNGEAITEFRRAAEFLKQNNRAEDYLKVGERIVYLDANDIALTRELANVYLAKGDTKRALAKLQACFKADPRDIETLHMLAQAFRDLGQLSKTVSVYKELAKIYSEQDKFDDERAVWRKVLEIAPEDPDARAALAPKKAAMSGPGPEEFPLAQGPKPNAPASGPPPGVAARAPAPPPGPPPGGKASTAGGRDQIPKLLTETDVYVKYGLHDKAVDHLKRILSIDPDNLDGNEKAVSVYTAVGNALAAQDAAVRVAQLCAQKGDVERGRPHYRKLMEQAPHLQELAELGATYGASAAHVVPEEGVLVEANDDEVLVADAEELVESDEEILVDPGEAMLDSAEVVMADELAAADAGELIEAGADEVIDIEQPEEEIDDALLAASHAEGEELIEEPSRTDDRGRFSTEAAAEEPVADELVPEHPGEEIAFGDASEPGTDLSDAGQAIAPGAGAAFAGEEASGGGAAFAGEEPFDTGAAGYPDEGGAAFADEAAAPGVGDEVGSAGPYASEEPDPAAVYATDDEAGEGPGEDGRTRFEPMPQPPVPAPRAAPIEIAAGSAEEYGPTMHGVRLEDLLPAGMDLRAPPPGVPPPPVAAEDEVAPPAVEEEDEPGALSSPVDDSGIHELPTQMVPGSSPELAELRRQFAHGFGDDDSAETTSPAGPKRAPRTPVPTVVRPAAAQAALLAEERAAGMADRGETRVVPPEAAADLQAAAEPAPAGQAETTAETAAYEENPWGLDADELAEINQEIEEADFFLTQEVFDEAEEIFRSILFRAPGHPVAEGRLAWIAERRAAGGVGEAPTAAAPAAAAPAPAAPALGEGESTGSFDLAAELAAELGPDGGAGADSGSFGAESDFQYAVEDVFEEFKKGVSQTVRPEDTQTHYDLGIAYKEMGLLPDAVSEFNTALHGCRGQAKEVDCLSMIGMCQVALGDQEQAIDSYKQALGAAAISADQTKAIHFEIAAACEALEDAPEALYHYGRVVKADSTFRDVKKRLERLKATGAVEAVHDDRSSGPRNGAAASTGRGAGGDDGPGGKPPPAGGGKARKIGYV